MKAQLKDISKWAKKWRFQFSGNKSATVVFSRKTTAPNDPKLKLGHQPLQHARSYKYLGVIFDEKLNWEAHVENINRKAEESGKVLQFLARRKCCPHIPTLISIYKALVRIVVDYGLPELLPATKTRIRSLETTRTSFLGRSYKRSNQPQSNNSQLSWVLNLSSIG